MNIYFQPEKAEEQDLFLMKKLEKDFKLFEQLIFELASKYYNLTLISGVPSKFAGNLLATDTPILAVLVEKDLFRKVDNPEDSVIGVFFLEVNDLIKTYKPKILPEEILYSKDRHNNPAFEDWVDEKFDKLKVREVQTPYTEHLFAPPSSLPELILSCALVSGSSTTISKEIVEDHRHYPVDVVTVEIVFTFADDDEHCYKLPPINFKFNQLQNLVERRLAKAELADLSKDKLN